MLSLTLLDAGLEKRNLFWLGQTWLSPNTCKVTIVYWDLPWLYKLCTDTQFCYRITSSGGGKNRGREGDLRKIISTGIHQLSPNTGCSGAPDVGSGTKIKLNVSSRPRHNGGNLSRVSARRSHPDNESLVSPRPGCQNLIITIQSPIIELAPPVSPEKISPLWSWLIYLSLLDKRDPCWLAN